MWLLRCLSNLGWIKKGMSFSQMLKLQNFNRLREIFIDNQIIFVENGRYEKSLTLLF